jgi:hypothetical protein
MTTHHPDRRHSANVFEEVVVGVGDEVIAPEIESLRQAAQRGACATGAEFSVEAGIRCSGR